VPEIIDRHTALEDLPEYLRVEELAAYWDCSKGVIYEMIRRDRLQVVKLGRLIRIKRDGLKEK
jgi:excisionase family DNA binding protein